MHRLVAIVSASLDDKPFAFLGHVNSPKKDKNWNGLSLGISVPAFTVIAW